MNEINGFSPLKWRNVCPHCFVIVLLLLQIVDEKTGEVLPEGEEENGASVVLLMVRDAYANYVVQTTLDVISECEEKRALLEELNAHATELVSQMRCLIASYVPLIETDSHYLTFMICFVSIADNLYIR